MGHLYVVSEDKIWISVYYPDHYSSFYHPLACTLSSVPSPGATYCMPFPTCHHLRCRTARTHHHRPLSHCIAKFSDRYVSLLAHRLPSTHGSSGASPYYHPPPSCSCHTLWTFSKIVEDMSTQQFRTLLHLQWSAVTSSPHHTTRPICCFAPVVSPMTLVGQTQARGRLDQA
jgi:hypothetical protein